MSELRPGIRDLPDEQREINDLLEETKALSNETINKLDRVFGAVLGMGAIQIGLLITLIVLTN